MADEAEVCTCGHGRDAHRERMHDCLTLGFEGPGCPCEAFVVATAAPAVKPVAVGPASFAAGKATRVAKAAGGSAKKK